MNEITKEDLFGRVIKSITGLEHGSQEVIIEFQDGGVIIQDHYKDCCEYVRVEQVDGNPQKHVGAVIHNITEKIVGLDDIPENERPDSRESFTATFYTVATSKGYLDWRWYGESNGYYSERVDCILKNK